MENFMGNVAERINEKVTEKVMEWKLALVSFFVLQLVFSMAVKAGASSNPYSPDQGESEENQSTVECTLDFQASGYGLQIMVLQGFKMEGLGSLNCVGKNSTSKMPVTMKFEMSPVGMRFGFFSYAGSIKFPQPMKDPKVVMGSYLVRSMQVAGGVGIANVAGFRLSRSGDLESASKEASFVCAFQNVLGMGFSGGFAQMTISDLE